MDSMDNYTEMFSSLQEMIKIQSQKIEELQAKLVKVGEDKKDVDENVFDANVINNAPEIDLEAALSAQQRVNWMVTDLDEDLDDYLDWKNTLSTALAMLGVEKEDQDNLFQGRAKPTAKLNRFINVIIMHTTKKAKLVRNIIQEEFNADHVNSSCRIMKSIQRLYEERTENRAAVKSRTLAKMQFTEGKLAAYNAEYLQIYEELVRMDKLKKQEHNVDNYLASLGTDEWVKDTKKDVIKRKDIKKKYKQGDLKAIMEIAVENFLLQYPQGEINNVVFNCYKCGKSGHLKRNCRNTSGKRNGQGKWRQSYENHKEENNHRIQNNQRIGINQRQSNSWRNNRSNRGNYYQGKNYNQKSVQTRFDNRSDGNSTKSNEEYNVTNYLNCCYQELQIENFSKIMAASISYDELTIVDSGCSFSITGNFQSLVEIRKDTSFTKLPDGKVVQTTHAGFYELPTSDKILVRYSKDLPQNLTLISVHDLTEIDFVVTFARYQSQMIKDGAKVNLQKWNKVWILPLTHTLYANLETHKRFGHASAYKLNSSRDFNCEVCKVSNIKLKSFNFPDDSKPKIMKDTIYCDYKVFTPNSMILIMVESRCRQIAVYYQRSKSETSDNIRRFIKALDYVPTKIVTDIDSPFNTKEFEQKFNDVCIEWVPPHKHKLLYAERIIQEVLKMFRSNLHSMPEKYRKEKFYPYIGSYVAFNLNRTYNKALNQSSYEARYKKTPPQKEFRQFWSRCVAKSLETTSSLRQKGIVCRFMGITHKTVVPSAFLFNESTGKILIRAFIDIEFLGDEDKEYKKYFTYAFKKNIMVDDDSDDEDFEIQNETTDDTDVENVESEEIQSNEEKVPETTVRRSAREQTKPDYYDPEKINQAPQWMTNYSTEEFNVTNMSIRAFELPKKPIEFRKRFTKPMIKELQNLFQHKVIQEVENVPEDAIIVPTQYVLEEKRDASNKNKYKARIVARGDLFSDRENNYSPTMKPMLILVLMQKYAESENAYVCKTLDISSAFLHGEQKYKNVYVTAPFPMNKNTFKLTGNLYGMANASKIWYDKFINVLEKFGMKVASCDQCLLYLQDFTLFLLIHVDDCLVIGTTDKVEELTKFLKKSFKVKSTTLQDFLGLNIVDDVKEVKITQTHYIEKILKKFQYENANPMKTPIAEGTYPELTKEATNAELKKLFQSITGSLIYLHLTRPDLDYAVSYLSRVQINPQEKDFIVAKRIIRYLKGSINYGLVFKKSEPKTMKLIAYSDASWKFGTKYGITGYAIFLNEVCVLHNTKKQTNVSDSIAMAEMIALKDTIKAIVFLMFVLKELQMSYERPVIYVDNSSIIDMLKANTSNKRSNHFLTHILYCRDQLKKVDVKWIETKKNIADTMTKALNNADFLEHREKLLKQISW